MHPTLIPSHGTRLSAVLLAGMALFPALRAEASRVEVTHAGDRARLLVEGRLIAAFRTPNGSLSPLERARLAADRLRRLSASADDVKVQKRGSDHAVLVNGQLIMVATEEEAAERRESTLATANRWATNLRQALAAGSPRGRRRGSRRQIEAPDAPWLVPPGETRTFTLRGGRGRLYARANRPSVAEVAVLNDTQVEVRGVERGEGVIRVSRGGSSLEVPVRVMPWAASVSRVPEVTVTGLLTPRDFIRRAALPHFLRALDLSPGNRAELLGSPEGVRALRPGEEAVLTCRVGASGEGHLPFRGEARVKVVNRTVPQRETQVLLYSNEPESVREFGILFEGLIRPESGARILYHHQNRMGRPFTLQVDLLNPGETESEVQVLEGDAGPYIDPLQAGHRAGQRYMAAQTTDLGLIQKVPARGSLRLGRYELATLQTVSAVSEVRSLHGGPLVVQVSAVPQPTDPEMRDDLLDTAGAEPHTYPNPTKTAEYKYVVGQAWTFVSIGRNAIAAGGSNRKLFGNYGVLYNITVELENPTALEQTVKLVMAPQAGWVRGVFVVEGKLIEAPQLAPPSEATLWSVKLAPGQQRRLSIVGLPVSGSAYPLSLVIRS